MKRFLFVSSRALDIVLFLFLAIPFYIIIFIQSLKSKNNEQRNQI